MITDNERIEAEKIWNQIFTDCELWNVCTIGKRLATVLHDERVMLQDQIKLLTERNEDLSRQLKRDIASDAITENKYRDMARRQRLRARHGFDLDAEMEPGLDELLDSVGAVGVTIERLKQGGKPTALWGATLYTDRFEYTGDKERSPMRALNGAAKHAREDAIDAARAQKEAQNG